MFLQKHKLGNITSELTNSPNIIGLVCCFNNSMYTVDINLLSHTVIYHHKVFLIIF